MIIFVIYNIVPCRIKNYVLLAAGIVFYAFFDLKYTLILFLIVLISFYAAKFIGSKAKPKLWLILGICSCLVILVFFKFWSYAQVIATRLLGATDIAFGAASIIAPIGISFFTLEAIGYMVDVYKGRVPAEEDFFKYALFISFFPKIMSGPIERSTNLLKQIHDGAEFNYQKVRHSFLLILWGSFIKLLIANRLAVIVNEAFDSYMEQTGFTMLVAVIIYGIQLYVDFAGYSYMAIGMAGVFGYDLVENFRQPYFSQNVRDFWRRWHTSLSSWLRDYVYIPLGGSRKGNARRCLNLIITFLVSGLWHGTGMHFVVWGMLHGIYQVLSILFEKIMAPYSTRINIKRDCFSHKMVTAVITFALVDFAWLFFRADSVGSALEILDKILFHPEVGRTIYENLMFAGVEIKKGGVLVFELLLLFIVDLYHEKRGQISELLDAQNKWFRWSVYVIITMFIVVGILRDYGVGASAFIYANF